jgi:hypothetical protein
MITGFARIFNVRVCFVQTMTARSLAFALTLVLAACDGRAARTGSASPSPEAEPGRGDPPSEPIGEVEGADDGSDVPLGPVVGGTCEHDDDCVPASPCGLQDDGACLTQSEAPQVIVECADPKPSTHRCVCTQGRCDSTPITADPSGAR